VREQAAAVVRAEEAPPLVPRQLRRESRLRRWLSGRTIR